MHQDYSPVAARVAPSLRSRSAAKHFGHASRRKDDWGKRMPFWCLSCGESMSVGSRSLTKVQRLEAFKLRNE